MSEDRWQEVKSKVEGLGLKLKLHLDQEQDENEPAPGSSDAKAALEEMGAKLQDAVDSLGNAAKDPAIRADMKDLGLLLRDAMNETLSTVGDEVGQILQKTKAEMTGDRRAGNGDDSGAETAQGSEGEADHGDAGDGTEGA